MAALAIACLIIITIPLAWRLARSRLCWKRGIESIILLPMVLPPTVLGYYLVVIFGRNGLVGKSVYEGLGWSVMFTWWGAVIAAAVVAFPILFQTAYIAIRTVDPCLEDVAYSMGASRWQAFWYISLPIARNGILSGIALAFARAMGEFGATLMLVGNIPGKTVTMPMAIYNSFSAGRLSEANSMALIYIALSMLVLIYVSTGGVVKLSQNA